MTSSTRAWVFLTALSTLLLGFGHGLAGREGLLWALVVSLSVNSYIYFYTEQRVISFFKTRELEGRDPWNAIKFTKELARKAKIPAPKIMVIDSPSPQSLPLGRSWKSGSIVITHGLLERLTPEELKAVLAYNITCIRYLNTVSFMIAGAFCNGLLRVTQSLDSVTRWLIGAKKDRNSPQSHFFTYLFAPAFSMILNLSINKNSYLEADKEASQLSENPDALAKALWKLESYSTTCPIQISPSYAHLFIVNPLTKKGWTRYFQAQPNADIRIKNLIGRYPI